MRKTRSHKSVFFSEPFHSRADLQGRRMRRFSVFVTLLLPLIARAVPVGEKRQLSLFNLVTFENLPCQTNDKTTGGTTTYRNGTCLTANQCSDQGGTHSGTCAQSFGVCCLFTQDECGATINKNQTYVRNKGFPSSFSESSSMCRYTVDTCNNDIQHIRLDFEVFSINGPSETNERDGDGGECQDTFTVSSQTNDNIPVICGLNSGQHMYIDVGLDFDDTRSVELKFNFLGEDELADGFSANNRVWEIKISQIPYYSEVNPPTGCLQYHWGYEGRFETFNFADADSNHLINQHYNVCFREEEGMCCMTYQSCRDVGSFSPTNPSTIEDEYIGNNYRCREDWIGIENFWQSTDRSGPLSSYKICGYLDTHETDVIHGTTCTTPFKATIHFDDGYDYLDGEELINRAGAAITRNQSKKVRAQARAERKEAKKAAKLEVRKQRQAAKAKKVNHRTKRQPPGPPGTEPVESRGICMVFKQEHCGVFYAQYRNGPSY